MTSRRAPRLDDNGVAAVVGFVLILAVAISYYAYVAKSDVPRWGEENELYWDELVGTAMDRLVREGDSSIGKQITVTGTIPRPPEPHSFDVPLIGRTQPIDPSGTLSFDNQCPGFESERRPATGAADLDQIVGGCLRFDAQPVYTRGFAYQIEHGALLRVQGQDAHISAGPPMKLRKLLDGSDPPQPQRYEIVLAMVGLTGPGSSSSVTSANVPIDFVAGASNTDLAQGANAHRVELTLGTQYPLAWKNWFNQRIAGAGFDLTQNAACVNTDVAAPCDQASALAANEVMVIFGGFALDSPTYVADISYTLTQGTYSVVIR